MEKAKLKVVSSARKPGCVVSVILPDGQELELAGVTATAIGCAPHDVPRVRVELLSLACMIEHRN